MKPLRRIMFCFLAGALCFSAPVTATEAGEAQQEEPEMLLLETETAPAAEQEPEIILEEPETQPGQAGEEESPASGAEEAETESGQTESLLTLEDIESFDSYEEAAGVSEEMTEYVTAGSTEITVTAAQIKSKGAYEAIQAALDEAKEHATEANPYTITVAAGSYSLDGCLCIYSYTTLKLNGVTLTRARDDCNMLRVGPIDGYSDGVTGYYYKKIVVEGGTLDGNLEQGCSATMVKAAHADGVTLRGVTMQNCLNAHIMETAGLKNLTVTQCTFQNMITDGSGYLKAYYEALQLDILYSTHMKGYRSEDLVISGVVIDSCTFRNVPTGVGSHTGILNKPMSNVKITNCTFIGNERSAIQFLYTKNLTIANNTITDTPRGIVITMAGSGIFRPSTLAAEGGLTTSASDTLSETENQNIVITGNQITMSDESNPYTEETRTAILVTGENKKSRGDAPDGNYPVVGVTISQNTISHITGHGIRLVDAKEVTITSNTLTHAALSYTEDYYGISLRESPQNGEISGNTITGAPSNGIYIYTGSSSGKISGNTVSDSGNNGIYVNGDSSADAIQDNTVKNAAGAGIAVNGSKVETIAGNTVESPKGHGIFVGGGSTVDSIRSNTVKDAGNHGIAAGASTVTTVSDNTVQSCQNQGILAYNQCVMTNVTGNRISSTGGSGIRYSGGSTGALIENNVITGAGSTAICVDTTSSVTKISEAVSLQAPVLSSVKNEKNGISVSWKAVTGASGYVVYRKKVGGSYQKIATLSGNDSVTYTDKSVKNANGTGYVYAVKAKNGKTLSAISKKTIYRLTSPTISSLKNTASGSLTVKWKKNAKCTGYQVKYKTGKTEKTVTVTKKSTLKKVISSLQEKATYKVWVRCYLKKSGTTYYSAWSTGKSVKLS